MKDKNRNQKKIMSTSGKRTSSSETICIPPRPLKCGDQKVLLNNPINNLIMYDITKEYNNRTPTIFNMELPEIFELPKYALIDLQTLSYKKTDKYDARIMESVKILSGSSKIYVKYRKNTKTHTEAHRTLTGSKKTLIESNKIKESNKTKEYRVLTNINTKFKDVNKVIFVFPIKSYENLLEESKSEGPKYKLLRLFENKIFLNELAKEYEEGGPIFKDKKVNLNRFISTFDFSKLKDSEELKNNVFEDLKDMNIESLLFGNETNEDLKSKNILTDRSLMGMVGLRNLNNTCYVNVALQILMNCKVFIKVLTECNIERYINKFNKMGTGGEITLAFKKFLCEYRKMCVNKEGVCGIITPNVFLNKFRGWNKYFDNKEEHDSTDFLFTLLGQIDEDLMSMKPTTLNDVFDFIKDNTKSIKKDNTQSIKKDNTQSIKFLSQDSNLKNTQFTSDSSSDDILEKPHNSNDILEKPHKLKIEIQNEQHLKHLKEKNSVTSILENIFFGKIILKNKCLNCEKTSTKEERFINIELRKPKQQLKDFIEAELHDKTEVYKINVPVKVKEIREYIKQEFQKNCLIIKNFEIHNSDEINLKKKTEENFLERSFSNLSLSNFEEEKVKICLISAEFTENKNISSEDLLEKLINLEYTFIRICFKNIFFITKYFNEILIKNNEFFKNTINGENRKFLETKIFNSTKNFLQKLFDFEIKVEMKLILKNNLLLINVYIKNKSIFEHKLKLKKLSIINSFPDLLNTSSPDLLNIKELKGPGEFNTSFYEYLNYEACLCKCQGENNSLSSVTLMFKSLPLYLIISIKRTEFKDNKVVKTSWNIEIPDILLLNKVKYKMTGLVNHVENLTYSHYTNFCIKGGIIWYCNDSTVKKVKGINDKNVYFVIFERDMNS